MDHQLPVPVIRMSSVLPPPFSLMSSTALRSPVALGVKVTVTVQNPPEVILASQLLVWLKSGAFEPLMPTVRGENRMSWAGI